MQLIFKAHQNYYLFVCFLRKRERRKEGRKGKRKWERKKPTGYINITEIKIFIKYLFHPCLLNFHMYPLRNDILLEMLVGCFYFDTDSIFLGPIGQLFLWGGMSQPGNRVSWVIVSHQNKAASFPTDFMSIDQAQGHSMQFRMLQEQGWEGRRTHRDPLQIQNLNSGPDNLPESDGGE